MQLSLKSVRRLLLFFIISLAISGATAIPVDRELLFLLQFVSPQSLAGMWGMGVLKSYQAVQQHYPFLLYGYDWLAFAHFVLAILFIGPYKDPVKNSWADCLCAGSAICFYNRWFQRHSILVAVD